MRDGLTEDKIQRLSSWTTDAAFSGRERAALSLAEAMALDHHRIDDARFAEVRREFAEPELLELGMAIGQYIGFGRLLKILDLEHA